MKTEQTEHNDALCGEIFFDAECPLCAGAVRRIGAVFVRRSFRWVPMQTSGTAKRLGIPEDNLRAEMQLLRADGALIGGINAWVHLLRSVWWLWPVGAFLQLPGIHFVANAAYRWLARNRYCFGGRCSLPIRRRRHRAFFELP